MGVPVASEINNLRQLRGRFRMKRFTVFACADLAPGVPTMVGPHAHEHDHLLVLHRDDEGPAPDYRVWYRDDKGDHEVQSAAFGFVVIKKGFQHWIEQRNPAAKGRFFCIFSNYDETGRIEDPMAEDEEGARYVDG